MSGVSTRSSRLNSREPFTNLVVSRRKAKSKKIINKSSQKITNKSSQKIINKSSQKININAKDKNLHVLKTNISANNSQSLSRRLRPRRNKKNYCEDSKLLQQYIPLNQQDSVVILEKLSLKNIEKVPVYKKAIKSFEKSLENKNDVYDFMFDINDTIEKATKKKKKRKINKKNGKMTKKTTRKKVIIQSKIIGNEENKSPGFDTNSFAKSTQSNPSESAVTKSTKKNKMKIDIPRIDTNIQIVEKSIKKDTMKKIASPKEEDTEKKIETPKTNIEIIKETSLETDRAFPEQIEMQNTKKPKIISIENANNVTIIKSSPNKTEEFLPFRPKNIFDNKTSIKQQKSLLNCSLLTKSLSPISKTTNTLDLGSPWRPPTLSMFSQAKHFIQSTPKLRLENNKKNMEMNENNMEINKENIKINKENMKVDKENMKVDKENKQNKKSKFGREKEKKKKTTSHKKHNIIQRKLLTKPEKVQTIDTNKHIQAAPSRISLGEIKDLLQTKPHINDNKQATNQVHVEVDKSLMKQKDKKLVNFLNFSDTFDVLSETERLSNFGADVPLFMDLEPSHFSKPPQYSYRRKRAMNCGLEDSGEEEEEENVKHRKKKKSEKENEKRVNEWIKTMNSTFEEIDEYDLLIE